MSDYFVYIITNKPRGTLYVGVTNNLVRRIYQHREGTMPSFTRRYGLKQLVHFERYDTPYLEHNPIGLNRKRDGGDSQRPTDRRVSSD
jgi:hypothetical protein